MINVKKVIVYSILGLWSLGIFVIFLWVFITSIKSNYEIFGNPWGVPSRFAFENYVTAWKLAKMELYFRNSVLTVIVAVLCNTMLSAMAAYALTRFKFKLKKSLLIYFIIGMAIPIQLVLLPQYSIFRQLGLTNKLSGLSLVYIVSSFSFSVFLLSGFFRSLPHELEESAIIDGCGEFRLFYRIMLPLTQPGLITSATLMFVNVWNEYLLALVYVGTKPKLRTMSLGMYFLRHTIKHADYGGFFAAIIIMIIPSLIVFITLQKYVLSGLTLGAVKG